MIKKNFVYLFLTVRILLTSFVFTLLITVLFKVVTLDYRLVDNSINLVEMFLTLYLLATFVFSIYFVLCYILRDKPSKNRLSTPKYTRYSQY